MVKFSRRRSRTEAVSFSFLLLPAAWRRGKQNVPRRPVQTWDCICSGHFCNDTTNVDIYLHPVLVPFPSACIDFSHGGFQWLSAAKSLRSNCVGSDARRQRTSGRQTRIRNDSLTGHDWRVFHCCRCSCCFPLHCSCWFFFLVQLLNMAAFGGGVGVRYCLFFWRGGGGADRNFVKKKQTARRYRRKQNCKYCVRLHWRDKGKILE